MVNGIGMMLKSMGIDPEMFAQLGAQLADQMRFQREMLIAIDARLVAIERALNLRNDNALTLVVENEHDKSASVPPAILGSH